MGRPTKAFEKSMQIKSISNPIEKTQGLRQIRAQSKKISIVAGTRHAPFTSFGGGGFKRSAHSAVAAKVDAIKEFKFERPVHEGGPARELGGPMPEDETNFEAKNWPQRPTWRPKVG